MRISSKIIKKESKAKTEVLPTRRSKRKRTISGPSAEQIIEEIHSKKPSKRSATKTFKKEEEIVVEQPSRRSATLNKSYTEYGDFDENSHREGNHAAECTTAFRQVELKILRPFRLSASSIGEDTVDILCLSTYASIRIIDTFHCS